MCENFKIGTCVPKKCTRAHEDDHKHYNNIVYAGSVSKVKKDEKPRRRNFSQRGLRADKAKWGRNVVIRSVPRRTARRGWNVSNKAEKPFLPL